MTDAVRDFSYQFDDRWAAGIFVVVFATIENVGMEAVCCLPDYRLQDSRGRFFTGDTGEGDAKVRHAEFWFGGSGPAQQSSDDYQPNLPRRAVFVYDIPKDATGLRLADEK